ncbi:MAG: TetR/AcrR family transcriptional regulator [bacterium]
MSDHVPVLDQVDPDPTGSATPRKHPRQDRARETVTAIVQAGAELIVELGYAGATTNKIAKRAGVSIGSLYQYFPNKDAIFLALFQQHQAAVRQIIANCQTQFDDPGIPLAETLRALFSNLVELHEINPRLNQALVQELPQPEQMEIKCQAENQAYIEQLEATLRRRPDVNRQNLEIAAHLLVRTTGAIARWLGHEAPPELDKREIIDETVAMLAGYILGSHS